MKNNHAKWSWACLGLSIASGLGLLYQRFRGFLLAKSFAPSAATIGIIGGADGPTAIFVTSKFSPNRIFLVLAMIAGIVGFILLRKPKK